MKKSFFSVWALLALLACSQEPFSPEIPQAVESESELVESVGRPVVFSARLPETKVALAEESNVLKFAWAEEDYILIFNKTKGKVSGTLDVDNISGASADFIGTLTNLDDGDELVAFYGKAITDDPGNVSADGVELDFSLQEGTLASCAENAPMYATLTYSESGNLPLSFKNVCAIAKLRVMLPADLDVAYLELSSDQASLYHGGVLGLDGSWSFRDDQAGPIVAQYAESLVAGKASAAAYVLVPAQQVDGALTLSAYDAQKGLYTDGIERLTDTEKGYFVDLNAASVSFEASKLQAFSKKLTGYVGSSANIDYQNTTLWKVRGEGVTTYYAADSAIQGGNPNRVDQMEHTVYYALAKATAPVTLILEQESAIGRQSFYAADQLFSVSAPKATSIAVIAFLQTASLYSVDFPQLISVGPQAFGNATALEEVSMPSVTLLQYYAFANATSLKKIDLPALKTLAYGVFMGCSALEEVSFPEAETFDIHVFNSCTSLKEVSFPKATKMGFDLDKGTEGGGVFSGCSALKSASLPKLTTLCKSLFNGCTSLTDVEFSPEVTEFPEALFYQCESLTDEAVEKLAEKVTKLGPNCFYKCTSLESLTFPKVTEMDSYVFDKTSNLKELHFLSEITQVNSDFSFITPEIAKQVDLFICSTQGNVITNAGEQTTDVDGANFAGATFKSITRM